MPIGTKISIEIDGQTLYRFSELKIKQEINNHHSFTLIQPMPREFVEQAVDKSQSYIGKPILVTIESSFLKTGGSLLFKGIVVQSEIVREFGVRSYIQIKGYSPTILLEGNPHIQSYTQKNIGDITREVLDKYSKQLLKTNIAPKNSSSLSYTVQYNENDFSFLKRLAQKKGEWFFFNGSELFLGDPNKGNTYDLYYGNNVHCVRIDMKAQPLGFSYVGYEPSSAETQKISSLELNHQEQGYARSVFEASKKLFPESGTYLYSQPIAESSTMPHLSDRAKTQLESKAASLITLYAESDEPGLRIGDKVKVTEPAFSPTNNPADGIKEQYFGEYILTKIEHYCDETGKYFNKFEAIPSSVQAPPYTHVLAYPQSGTQPAIVTDNNDPKGLGRVKVKFSWQREETSPWLRMTNPHAGGGKGMYFIPEKGEEVLIGFEDNNAEKPFVLGAVYNGKGKSDHHTAGNDKKVIQSRSGTKIILDDSKSSVHIEDPSGNTWTLDGNGKITVHAPEEISFSTKAFKIDASETITFNGTNKVTIETKEAEINGSTSVKTTSNSLIESEAAKIEIKAKATVNIEASATVDVNGKAMTNVKGGLLNLN